MIGTHIIELEESESTNRYAFNLLSKNDVAEGTVITAMYQSSGRGLGNNKWESEKGKNLTLSIILYPSFLPLDKQFMLNKMISLGIYDMISHLIQNIQTVKIKWPNDIYIGNKKVSGTLIENAIVGNTFQQAIIGIGININQDIFFSDATNPVSLKNITNKEFDKKECLDLLCSCIEERYSQLKDSFYNLLDEEYLSALFRKDELATYIYKNQMIVAAIKEISEEGKLILETIEKEIIECNFKEIEFVI